MHYLACHLKPSSMQNKRPNLQLLSLRQTFSCLLFSQHSVLTADPYLSINLFQVSPTDKSTIEGNINATNTIVTNAKLSPWLFSSIWNLFILYFYELSLFHYLSKKWTKISIKYYILHVLSKHIGITVFSFILDIILKIKKQRLYYKHH